MSGRAGVLAGGNWIVDRVKFIDTYPCQDALASILSEAAANGGSPFNLLVDLAKLGARFPLLGEIMGASGIFRVYLKQVRPHFQLYISPINIDPSAPELPISTPA